MKNNFKNIEFQWIPREKNQQADIQSHYALYVVVEEKAKSVLDKYKIIKNDDKYILESPENKKWTVHKDQDGMYKCDCPAFRYSKRMMLCKHVVAIFHKNNKKVI
jgi:hypothetical protein